MKKMFLVAFVLLCSASFGSDNTNDNTLNECLDGCGQYLEMRCTPSEIPAGGNKKRECTMPDYKKYNECFIDCRNNK